MVERNTPQRTGMIDYVADYEMAASETIEAGKMVALLLSTGYAVDYSPATNGSAADKMIVGRCEETVTNSGGDGAARVRARIGVFRWNNDAPGKVATRAHIGDDVYALDDETIQTDAHTQAGGSTECAKAGILIEVDSDGAWVATGIPFLQ